MHSVEEAGAHAGLTSVAHRTGLTWGRVPIAPLESSVKLKSMRQATSRVLKTLRRLAGPKYPIPVRLVACTRCKSSYVVPVAWQEQDEASWWLRLRCGECGFVREVEVSDEDVKRFERELDRGVREIAATVAHFEAAARDAHPDALNCALRRDLFPPSDSKFSP